jgi:hypothetical protein
METDDVRTALERLVEWRIAKIDLRLRVLRVLNVANYTVSPPNGNVIRGWYSAWVTLPESPLKYEHIETLALIVGNGSQHHRRAWEETFARVERPNLEEPMQTDLPLSGTQGNGSGNGYKFTTELPLNGGNGSGNGSNHSGSAVFSAFPNKIRGGETVSKRFSETVSKRTYPDPPPYPDPDPDPERACARARERARMCAPAPARAYVETAHELWQLQEHLRVLANPANRRNEPTATDLERIAKLLAEGRTREECEHALWVYADEERRRPPGKKSWFDGVSNWQPENVTRALGRPEPRWRREVEDARVADDEHASPEGRFVSADEAFGKPLLQAFVDGLGERASPGLVGMYRASQSAKPRGSDGARERDEGRR